jgi:hypothetical protein
LDEVAKGGHGQLSTEAKKLLDDFNTAMEDTNMAEKDPNYYDKMISRYSNYAGWVQGKVDRSPVDPSPVDLSPVNSSGVTITVSSPRTPQNTSPKT